ncbi:MAG: hypothetical protein IRZ00_20775, partial [Gemmatimonadetes bacterium]|nr:hypothetical protein [Gemmatimonadota bacterium]
MRYLGEVERQQQAHVQLHGDPADYAAHARALLANHRARRTLAGRALAAYVPWFYGLRLDEVFASTVTEDEARLAVARTNGAPSWARIRDRNRSPEPGRTLRAGLTAGRGGDCGPTADGEHTGSDVG